MLFSRIFAAAALVATAVAQSKIIQFTTLPSNVEVGKPVSIKWTGGDGSPVTITLKKGPPKNLKTITVLTGGVSGNSYTWTPTEDLADGDDYALQISQGIDGNNYTGQFSVSGGNGSSSSSSSDAATSTATTTVKGTTSVTSTVYASTGTVTIARNTTMVSPTLSATRSGGLSAGTDAPSATRSSPASASSPGAASNVKVQAIMGLGAFAAAAVLVL